MNPRQPARLGIFFIGFLVLAPLARADRWLVRVPPATAKAVDKSSSYTVIRRYKFIPWEVVEANDAQKTWLQKQVKDGTLQAEPDNQVKLSALPNDPMLSSQAFVQPANPDADIHLAEAWDVQTSASAGPVIAVVDSGVDTTHPDLIANLWQNPGEVGKTPGVDDDGNGYIDDIHGWNVLNNDASVSDTLFHGTHVSGIIGAVGNNGVGITGVCWSCQIMEVRCFDPSNYNLSDALAGLDYVFTCPQVRVVNASWGDPTYSQALADAVSVAGQKNITIVAAAGNTIDDIDTTPFYPAALNVDNVVTVAGIQEDGHLWDSGTPAFGSSYGTLVAVAAPASPVYSTRPGGTYLADSGTSYAVPHVVGAIALLLTRMPNLTCAQIKHRLIATSRHTDALNGAILGGGLLDVKAFLSAPLQTTPDAARNWNCYN